MQTIYLITGAAGFVGNHVVKILAAKGVKIRALVFTKGKEKTALENINAEFFYGDIRKPADLEQLFKKEDSSEYIFIHIASKVDIGVTSFNQELHDINVSGTKNVLSACKAHKVKRLVYVSSVHAITEPKKRALTIEAESFSPESVHGAYAKTKAEASACVLEAVKDSLNAVLVHPAGIIGPGDFSNTHTTQLIIDFAKHRIPAGVIGGYDFVDVRDVAKAVTAAINTGKPGSRWIVSGHYTTIKNMFNILGRILGEKKSLSMMPMWLAMAGLPFLWFFAVITGKRPLYTRYSLYTLRSNSNFSYAKAEAELKHKPRSLEETLTDTAAFLKQQGKL
ncbi:MAG: NAD-dependent epimerase/dehydratase family protein [Treponema sp.]|nr:NAD-dependent epimerase/dehydratase family protein [Treponema sp.]